MKRILTIAATLISSIAYSQDTKTPFATTPSPIANRYAYTNNGLWVDSTVKLIKYKSDSGKVAILAIDTSGKVYKFDLDSAFSQQDLDAVLARGGELSDHREISMNGYTISFSNGKVAFGDTVSVDEHIRAEKYMYYTVPYSGTSDRDVPDRGWVTNAIIDSSNSLLFPTVDSMMNYGGNLKIAVVSDTLRGGVFTKQESGIIDSGIVFPSADGAYWHRVRNDNTIQLSWYGINENSDSLYNSWKFYQLIKLNNVIKITTDFKIASMIGAVDEVTTDTVKCPITIIGINNPVIKNVATSSIRSVLGLSVKSYYPIHITGITIDVDSLAPRGIYIKTFDTGKLSETLEIDHCTVLNAVSNDITNPSLIVLLGNMNMSVHDCHLDRCGSPTKVSQALLFGAAGAYSYPSGVDVYGNTIENVFSSDSTNMLNQDAIAVRMKDGDRKSPVRIYNNYVHNARTRFIKIQSLNANVYDNTFVNDGVYTQRGNTVTIGVDFQFGNGNAHHNTFYYENGGHEKVIGGALSSDPFMNIHDNTIYLSGDSLLTMAAFSVSDNDASTSYNSSISLDHNNITVGATGHLNYFYSHRTSQRMTDYVSLNNNTIAGIDSSITYLWTFGSGTGTDSINFNYIDNNLKTNLTPIIVNGTIPYYLSGNNNYSLSGTLGKDYIKKTLSNKISQNGDSFGGVMVIGTNDNNRLDFIINGTVRARLQASGFTMGVPLTTSATASGNGTTTVTITLPASSTYASVIPANPDAGDAGVKYVTVSGTTLTIYTNNATASGTNNLSYFVEYK